MSDTRPVATFKDREVGEGSTTLYSARFSGLTPSEQNLVGAAITAIAVTLTREDGTIINNRDDQDVRNTNGGTLTTDGLFTLVLGPDDNAVDLVDVDPDNPREVHILGVHVEYTRAGGGDPGELNYARRYSVRKLAHIL